MEDNISEFQKDCIHFLTNYPLLFKWIYWDKVPVSLIGKELNLSLSIIDLEWNNNLKIDSVYLDSEFKTPEIIRQFRQGCNAYLQIVFVSSIENPINFQTEVYFRVDYYEPLRNKFKIFVENEYSQTIEAFQKCLIQKHYNFGLVTIEATKFISKNAFAFFCEILRTERLTQPQNKKIKNGEFYNQIVHSHIELSVAITHIISYLPFTNKLTGRKDVENGKTFFMPNIHHMDYQFYLWCSVCIERFYTFWETLIVLLYSYDPLNVKQKNLSFGIYIKDIVKSSTSIFKKDSENLMWIISFYKEEYHKIIKYRHRIVHHNFTSDNEGLFSSKFFINAYQNIGNEQALKQYETEIQELPSLFITHFNLCKEGFKRMLLLINELE